MDVVSHYIEPINVGLEAHDVEAFEIPVRGRLCNLFVRIDVDEMIKNKGNDRNRLTSVIESPMVTPISLRRLRMFLMSDT